MKAPLIAVLVVGAALSAAAQSRAPQPQPPPPQPPPAAATPTAQKPPADPAATAAAAAGVLPPPDYVIGAEDVLDVVVWREKELSAEVMVRPDGMVSLPLLNDVQAGGLTPEQFRVRVSAGAAKYVESPSVTVIVKQINSRKISVMGEVVKPGIYPLLAPTTVLQLLAQAGGPTAFADVKDISVVRTVDGKTTRLVFNYKEVARGRRMEQNVLLRPGDTVIIP
jgi:polysaccharide biosynthesis/export protein